MSKKFFQLITSSLCYLAAMTTLVTADNNQCVTVKVHTAEGSEPISYYYDTCSCQYSDRSQCYPDTARPGTSNVAITSTAYLGGVINPGPQNHTDEFPDDYPINNKLNEYCCDSRTQKCTTGKCPKSKVKKKKNLKNKN